MVVVASALERFLPVLLVLPLLLSARAVRRLADRPDAAARRRSARSALVGMAVAAVLLATWAGAAVALAGEPASSPRSWIVVALLAGPLVAAARHTVPALLGVARRSRRGSAPDDGPALAATRVVLPARLLPPAAGAAAVVTAAAQPSVRVLGVLVLVLVAAIAAVDTGQRARRAAGLPAVVRWPARGRLAAPLVLVLATAGCALAGTSGSALPAAHALGGHGAHPAELGATPVRDVRDLVAEPAAGPARRITLVADETRVALSSGALVDAWTFNGTLPGSEIRVRQGEDVEVRLINRLDTESTTIHWHGVDVPNAMDGVAGVTQDAVPPGGEFVYRFRADRPGTYWYHAHQASSVQVARGLFGAFVVEPGAGRVADVDDALLIHEWSTDRGDGLAVDRADRPEVRPAAPGATVRVRMVNTESFSRDLVVTGAPFRLVALDGSDLHEPGSLTSERIPLGGGGRADLAFVMPQTPVRIGVAGAADLGVVYSPDGATTGAPTGPTTGAATGAPTMPAEALDITRYGTPAPTPFGPADRPDRQYRMQIGEGLGFSRGGLDYVYTINGEVFPQVPPLAVTEGELVQVTIANGGLVEHPMHLHGHHVLVLARDGRPVTGSPLWLDTVLVRPGETWEVVFRADNPGIWMDHCHILFHAAAGMIMHLEYDGVATRFDAGSASGNVPE